MKKLAPSYRKNTIPQWQLNKMKTIIAERWQEVRQLAELRSRYEKNCLGINHIYSKPD